MTPEAPSGFDPSPAWRGDDTPLRIGISACLLGHPVRYDGGHKRSGLLVELLGPWVEWVTVCPEVELGLGVPRPTLRLERVGAPGDLPGSASVRLVRPSDGVDLTHDMQRLAQRRARELGGRDLCGYILKKDSPSCGMERVKVYADRGAPRRDGVGVFAAALAERHPLLPIEEEGRMCDMDLRENFIERVFAYHRLKSFFAARWSVGGLVAFQAAHKLQLMAHSPKGARELGQLVARAKGANRRSLREDYSRAFMQTLRCAATRPRHVNVMEHMIGYLRRGLGAAARQEMADLIQDYRSGIVPLVVPLTLLRHHIRALDIEYLRGQLYLEPHPKELMLRNHA